MNIYDFTVKDTKGNDVSLSEYKGKALLIVNTATKCGFTPQYEGLEKLYETYKDQGFEILDFPCNQFLNQAPGSNEEVASFCQLNFGTKFKTFGKINVNGKDAHPLYNYLKEQKPKDYQDPDLSGFKEKLQSLKQKVTGDRIKWNFTKFLVDRNGNVVERYASTFKPEDLKEEIEKVL
jgi:glutathione peroxidase